jgi:hypothetical protein
MDSDIYANPKVAEFVDAHGQKGLAALAVWQFAIQYSGAHATDGQIHKAVLRMIHGTPVHARLLIEGGFFTADENGWVIDGYINHQPSRATTDAIREARSEAGRKGAAKRWAGDET